MNKFCALTFALLLFATQAFAGDTFFNSHPTLWKDPDILIWTPDAEPPIDPKEFCLSLRRNNTGIGNPKCRLFGEWERDSVAIRYALWLQKNMEKGIGPEYLRARHPAMKAKLQTVEDKIVLYLAVVDNKVKIALFDETAVEPKAAGEARLNTDKIALGDEIASEYFNANAKRRLTKDERQKMQTAPDDFYQEVPTFKSWVGIAAGYSQAKIPLTPDNWYRSHIKSKVRNYRITKDSVSLWNFLDDSAPVFSLYAGGTWYGFIGMELIYRFAVHDVKTDDKDTVYKELDYWKFYQHEIGLNVILSRTYPITKWFDITPFAFLGFQYSFFVEDINLKSNVKEPSRAYGVRVEFEEAYKGALVGVGSQFIFKKHYGIGVRTGISSRGRNMYSDPTPDAAAEPTTIGESTIDWFISAGLEYHWSL